LLEYFAAVFSREKSSYSKNSNIKSQAAKNIIVKTWVSDKFFNNDGKFKDVYFNTLSDWLVESGYNVKLLPVLMNSEMPIKKIMPFIRKKENKFLVLWDYLKPVDIFKAIGKGLGQLSLKFNKFEFKGLNIKKLLKQQRRSFALSNRGLNCILQYYFFERLSKKSFKIDRVIYTFENMLPEKLFIIAIRTFYPNTKIVGFQHSVLYPLHLALYISENEADSAPLPDKIVCSGEFFKKIFSNEYYPSDILKTGPALRFGYLFDKQHNQDESYGNKVMLVLPGYKSEALYLLVKTLSALKDEDIVVHIKPHPLTDLEDVRHVMEKVGFSHQKIVIEKKALQELTGQCGLMITVSSSVIFDAIASGVPVLRVKKEIDLDLDPADWLDYDPKRDFVAFSSEDIRVEVKRALSLNKHERDSLKYYAKRFIEETFSPITENTLSVFVKQ
jgi:surface carbohydrate biosynthesis protein (TIGR04326 family)